MDVAVAHAIVDTSKNAMHVPPVAKAIRPPWLAATSSIPTHIQLVIPGMTDARQCAVAICAQSDRLATIIRATAKDAIARWFHQLRDPIWGLIATC